LSGNVRKAIEYLHLAGQQALQRSAYAEAVSHLTTALELLTTLPDTPEHLQQELMLQLALGAPLRIAKGYTAPEVEKVYTRARALCHRLRETSQLFPALWGLWYFYFVRAEYQSARELGQQCLTLAQSVQDSALLVEAHFALGLTLRSLGEFAPARELLEQGVGLYNLQQHHALAFRYGQDPKVASLCNMAFTLWELGYPDQALTRVHDALALAQELSHPFSLAYALISAALLHQSRREEQLAQELAGATITLCTEQGFPFWLTYGTILQGWVRAEQGQGEEGIAQIRQGLAGVRATGTGLGRPHNLAVLAEAYGKVGQIEEGLNMLTEALAVVDKTGERYYEAEIYRLKGTLTLQSKVQGLKSKVEEAKECFLRGIEIAQRQQAKSLELRAVVSLARLWQRQGKRAEAHKLLSEIYGWFTEGFDTKDLQEAKALLDQLTEGQ
jgi:predicted ATPase